MPICRCVGENEYDTVCDHCGGFRCGRVSTSHICDNHRDAHHKLGNLHRLHRLACETIGENEDGFSYSARNLWCRGRCRSADIFVRVGRLVWSAFWIRLCGR